MVLRALVTVSIQVVASVLSQFVPRDQGKVVGYRDSTTSTSKEVLTFVLNLNLTYCSVLLQDFLGMTMRMFYGSIGQTGTNPVNRDLPLDLQP